MNCPLCGHSINKHEAYGCMYRLTGEIGKNLCPCLESAETIAEQLIEKARRESFHEGYTAAQIEREMEADSATLAEKVNAAYGAGNVEDARTSVKKVSVSKSFAEHWTSDPQHYKDHYGSQEVEIQD